MDDYDFDFCTSCGELVDKTRLVDVAGYQVCEDCEREIKEAVEKMIDDFMATHEIREEYGRSKREIAIDLLFQRMEDY